MRILYLCGWSFHEGLTRASAIPSVRVLAGRTGVEHLLFCTLERKEEWLLDASQAKLIAALGKNVQHWPIPILGGGFFAKLREHTSVLHRIAVLCAKKHIHMLWARGSMAGAMAYRLHKRLHIPFVVESFEPHASYMHAAGVWRCYDPRYVLQHHWEQQQKKYAWKLLPVTHGYATRLKKEGVPPKRLEVLPCTVSAKTFAFSAAARRVGRKALGVSEKDILGVYVGKFGQLYLSPKEAAQFFASLRAAGLQPLKLLILTPQFPSIIASALQHVGFSSTHYFLKTVAHQHVPDYLSAADFAFSLHRALPPMRYISAIKNGEYWANGLPILLPKGVGDDYEIVTREGGGVCFSPGEKNLSAVVTALHTFIALRKAGKHEEMVRIATEHRNSKQINSCFNKLLKEYAKI